MPGSTPTTVPSTSAAAGRNTPDGLAPGVMSSRESKRYSPVPLSVRSWDQKEGGAGFAACAWAQPPRAAKAATAVRSLRCLIAGLLVAAVDVGDVMRAVLDDSVGAGAQAGAGLGRV